MNEIPSLKEIVKDNKVYFSHYRANIMYYKVDVNSETYMFTVPIEDVGDAIFEAIDKAMLFMRYIRKSLDEKTFVLV